MLCYGVLADIADIVSIRQSVELIIVTSTQLFTERKLVEKKMKFFANITLEVKPCETQSLCLAFHNFVIVIEGRSKVGKWNYI